MRMGNSKQRVQTLWKGDGLAPNHRKSQVPNLSTSMIRQNFRYGRPYRIGIHENQLACIGRYAIHQISKLLCYKLINLKFLPK